MLRVQYKGAPVVSAVAMGTGREALPADAKPSSAIASALSTSAACKQPHHMSQKLHMGYTCPITIPFVATLTRHDYVARGTEGPVCTSARYMCRCPLLSVKKMQASYRNRNNHPLFTVDVLECAVKFMSSDCK